MCTHAHFYNVIVILYLYNFSKIFSSTNIKLGAYDDCIFFSFFSFVSLSFFRGGRVLVLFSAWYLEINHSKIACRWNKFLQNIHFLLLDIIFHILCLKIGVCYDWTFFSVSREWFMSFDTARSGYVSFKSKIYFFFKIMRYKVLKCTNYKKIKTHSAGNVEYVNLNQGFFFLLQLVPLVST